MISYRKENCNYHEYFLFIFAMSMCVHITKIPLFLPLLVPYYISSDVLTLNGERKNNFPTFLVLVAKNPAVVKNKKKRKIKNNNIHEKIFITCIPHLFIGETQENFLKWPKACL